MLSIRTQTAIAVLQDLSFDTVLQTANFLLSEGEWKDLFDKLEAGRLIRRLPNKEPGILSSYELSRPLSDISLLDVLEATNEPIRCNMPTLEEFYIYHRQIANKIGVFNQVARTFLADIKIADW
jgi:DNA-binding IscR family transcriptional regulator